MSNIIRRPIFEQFAGVMIFLGLIYLVVTSSVYAQQGKPEEALMLITTASALLFVFIIPFVYIIMVHTGIAFSNKKVTDVLHGKTAFEWSAIGLITGFVGWTFFISNSVIASIVALPQAIAFSTVEGVIPQFWSVFVVAVAAPVAEEIAFMSALPLFIFIFLDSIANEMGLKFLKNPLISIGAVLLITVPVFTYLHVGNQALVSFLVAAIIFRIIIIGLAWGDLLHDVVPFVALSLPFAIGVHIANNVAATVGVVDFFVLMATYGFVSGEVYAIIVGWCVIVFFALPLFVTILAMKSFLEKGTVDITGKR
jgi:hypothetical protein